MSPSRRGQSLVEFALIAPVVILLAMGAWDGGSVLREQVVLQQAARDGARAAATAYGPGASLAVVQDAVLASAADLPALRNTTGYLSLTYPDAQSVSVRLQYAHSLITPLLRQLWGGGQGTVMLSASAKFYLPQLTPVPATIVASTPIPTATPMPTATLTPTPTPTLTPTATVTPTATPSVPLNVPCPQYPATISVQPLDPNYGYWCTLQVTGSSFIVGYWQVNNDPNKQLLIYSGNPFAGPQDPVQTAPPGTSVSASWRDQSGQLWAATGCVPSGTYSAYFFNSGSRYSSSSGFVAAVGCGGEQGGGQGD